MIPKTICSVCGAEVQRVDKFCPGCGARIEWDGVDRAAIETDSKPDVQAAPSSTRPQQICNLCGHTNPPDVSYCDQCGALLAAVAAKKSAKHGTSRGSPVLRFLQSWKLTAALGGILVVVLVYVGLSRQQSGHVHDHEHEHEHHSPRVTEIMNEIDALEKQIDVNPDDPQALIRLANMLHDVQFFPRAVLIYNRYLALNPSDADARVDLGICYFELAMRDADRKAEYLTLAMGEIEKALSYDPKHQTAHFNLGIVHLRSGNMEEANRWFKKCYELNPNSETGKRAQQIYSQHQFNNPS